ncbi:MAG: hypothetical protein KIT58_01540 [Planctomycetota bacterium]|nr:hypothetical protein [Planctomycetota bacterium]
MAGHDDAQRGVSGRLTRLREGAERVELLCSAIALWLGGAGLLALAACAGLALLPEDRWPDALDPRRLPVYAAVSLLAASLVGWGIVQQGMVRLRQGLGPLVGGLVFVALPLLCEGTTALAARDVLDPLTWPGGPVLAPVMRWYSPVLVALTLVAYGTWKARPRQPGRLGRGVGLALVVTPYALLMASLTFGVSAPWLQGPLGEALEALGGGALAAQLVLAFLVAA